MSPRSRLGAAVAWIIGPLTYLTLEAVAAAAFPHYSYAQNFISDLGVGGIPAGLADEHRVLCAGDVVSRRRRLHSFVLLKSVRLGYFSLLPPRMRSETC